MLPVVGILLQTLATTFVVTALEHYDNFREGGCSEYPAPPIKASREFVDSLKYIPGGSKYHFYRTTSSALPSNVYNSMTENELIQSACFTRNTTTTVQNSTATAFGFGQALNSVRMVSRPGIYFEGLPLNPTTSSVGLRDVVTLTDNKSFAFIAVCWTDRESGALEERGWGVVTNTPNVDFPTRRIIEEHAASLGFRRENFVFLSYERCYRDSNIL